MRLSSHITYSLFLTGFCGRTNNYRSYEVKSLDIDTQIRSENFFLRYRLLSLIEAIIASDPKTGPEDRTIDYFINQYISKFAAGYSRIREHQRLIYDSDDSDVDSDGNTKKKRHLRTVHRADVRGIFASQAEWILKDQVFLRLLLFRSNALENDMLSNFKLERKGRYLLNISKWTQFCKEVKINRRDARENGRRWGLPRGHEIGADDSDSEIDFKLAGSFSEGALTRLKRILKRVNEKPSKSRSKSKSKGRGKQVRRPSYHRCLSHFTGLPQRAAVPVVSSESEDMQDPDEEPYVLPQHVYDSDFSVPSTPSASSSSDDDSEVENPEIYKLLPQPFWHPPKPPGLDFRWCCPAAGCMYVIDMLNLTDENVRGLHVDEAAFLRAKMWERLHSDRVSKNFLRMVSNHYDQHMLEVGVVWKNFCTTAVGISALPHRILSDGSFQAELVWENPKRHALWPPKHKKKLVQHAEEIKEEEVDETHLPSSSHAGSSRTLRSNITRLSFET